MLIDTQLAKTVMVLIIAAYSFLHHSLFFPYFRLTSSICPRNPDGIGIPTIRNAPNDLKIAALFNLVENRIARPRSDPVLSCQMRDAFGFIEFSVNQKFRRL